MRTEGKNLILLEMIVVLFFFSLSATIALQLFVAAYDQSVASENEISYYLLAEDIMEQISHDPFAAGEVLDPAAGWTQTADTGSGVWYECDFDRRFRPLPDAGKAAYRMRVNLYDEARSEAGVLTGMVVEVDQIQADGAGEVCLRLTGKQYVPSYAEVFA